MSKTTESKTVEIKIASKFRATVFNLGTPCGNPAFTSPWCDTYEEAETIMHEFLVDVGTGYAGEVEKVSMTERTWDAVLAPKDGDE